MLTHHARWFALGAAAWFALSPARAETRKSDSPLVLAGQTDALGVTPLRLDLDRYTALKGAEGLLVQGLPLDDGRSVDLRLEPFEVLTPDAQIVVGSGDSQRLLPRPDVLLLSGEVVSREGSHVYLALAPTGSHGMIELEGRIFIISSGPFTESRNTVIYDRDALPDGVISWGGFDCYADLVSGPGLHALPGGNGQGSIDEPPCRVAEVAIETDREFTGDLFGGNLNAAAAYLLQLTGAVSEIYQRDVNARLKVTYYRLWDTANDPWTQGDTINQLFQFIDYWEANMGHIVRNDAHFYSGRGLGGGVAYLPGLCQGEFAYALSANLNGFFPYPLQDKHDQNWDPFVVAHEFGHNFGAPHSHDMNPPIDNCASGVCGVDGTIMSYCHTCPGGMTNILLRFHQRTIDEAILPYLDQAPCNLTQHPDCNPVNCQLVQQVKAKCKSGKSRVKGTVKTGLPAGTALTLSLNGGDAQTVTTDGNGRASATWSGVAPGRKEVCVVECGKCASCDL